MLVDFKKKDLVFTFVSCYIFYRMKYKTKLINKYSFIEVDNDKFNVEG